MPHTPHCSRSSLSTPTPVRGALLAPTTAPSRPHTPAPAPAAATYPGACMRPMMAATKKSEPGGATALPAPLPQERASPLPAPPRTTANQRALRAVGGLRGRCAPRRQGGYRRRAASPAPPPPPQPPPADSEDQYTLFFFVWVFFLCSPRIAFNVLTGQLQSHIEPVRCGHDGGQYCTSLGTSSFN